MCLINYFYKDLSKEFKFKPEYYVKQRKLRPLINNSYKFKIFEVGDILEFVFYYKSKPLIFSGICISIRRKNYILPDLALTIRNIIMKSIFEIVISYYYNRVYKLKFLDYRRKFFTFSKNKMYYIRIRLNQESRVG